MSEFIGFVIFMLAVIGMSHIIVDGSIFAPFKAWLGAEKSENVLMNIFMNIGIIKWSRAKLLALMSCYQCSGFWSGIIIGLAMWYICKDPLLMGCDAYNWVAVAVFCYGCAGSFLSTIAAVTLMWIQAKLG